MALYAFLALYWVKNKTPIVEKFSQVAIDIKIAKSWILLHEALIFRPRKNTTANFSKAKVEFEAAFYNVSSCYQRFLQHPWLIIAFFCQKVTLNFG